MFEYLIVYSWERRNNTRQGMKKSTGIGTMGAVLPKIKDCKDILDLNEEIKDKYNLSKVVITRYQKIKRVSWIKHSLNDMEMVLNKYIDTYPDLVKLYDEEK